MRVSRNNLVRHDIGTLDYWARLKGVSPEVARDLFSILIEQPDAERLLTEAGAPRPWQQPAAAFGLIMWKMGIEAPWRSRAQAAMDELRLVLPQLIEFESDDQAFLNTIVGLLDEFFAYEKALTEDDEPVPPPIVRRTRNGPRSQRTDLLTQLFYLLLRLQELPDIAPRRQRKEWHRAAIGMLRYYRAIVDPACGVSADGPAVRFIRAAIKRLSDGHAALKAIDNVTPKAVETALLRFRDAFPGDPFAPPMIPPTEDAWKPETPANGS